MLIDLHRIVHCILTTQVHCTEGLRFSTFIFSAVGDTSSWKEKERRDAETTTEYEEGTAGILRVDS